MSIAVTTMVSLGTVIIGRYCAERVALPRFSVSLPARVNTSGNAYEKGNHDSRPEGSSGNYNHRTLGRAIGGPSQAIVRTPTSTGSPGFYEH